MKILTTYDEAARLIEKGFVAEKCKDISDKLKKISDDIKETKDSLLIADLTFCKAMIEIMLQNLVIFER